MPKYAIVTVIESPQAEMAWESVGEKLLNGSLAQGSVAYIGAPWVVPNDHAEGDTEYGTDAIRLRVNGDCVNLSPAD